MLIEHTQGFKVCTGLPTARQVEFEGVVIMSEAVKQASDNCSAQFWEMGEKAFSRHWTQ